MSDEVIIALITAASTILTACIGALVAIAKENKLVVVILVALTAGMVGLLLGVVVSNLFVKQVGQASPVLVTTIQPSNPVIAQPTNSNPSSQQLSQKNCTDWCISHPADTHKRVEFKRCNQYPNDGFPEFDNRAGYIPLKLDSAGVVNGQFAWCFQIRFMTPLDEWRQYVKEIDPVYQNKEPDGIAVYFPLNQPQPPNLQVIVDDSLELGFPPDGVAFQSSRTIRVLLPLDAKQEPIVVTGPYEINASYILR